MTLTYKQKQILQLYDIDRLCDFLKVYPLRYEIIQATDESSMNIDDFIVLEGYITSSIRSRYYTKNKSVSNFKFQTVNQLYQVTIFNRPWLKTPDPEQACTVIGKLSGHGNIVASTLYFKPIVEIEGIHPIYPLKNKITQKQIKSVIKKVYALCEKAQIEPFPTSHLLNKGYLSMMEAQGVIHFPKDQDHLKLAIETLKYIEFFDYHLRLMIHQRFNAVLYKAKKHFDRLTISNMINRLPFTLTDDQLKVLDEILADLETNKPMMRLLQGDVGSGKTIVAILAALACVDAGYQVALLAPTEILATQHFNHLRRMIDDPSITIAFLSSTLPARDKADVYRKLEDQKIDILVGTHAIFQEAVTFSKLGLVITDEQHRFGVMQRRALIQKAEIVDVLSMSATPIPRTMAAALFSDMDVSTIESMPKNRKPIVTKLIKENSLRSFMDDLLLEIQKKHQVYVVCPAIDPASNQTRNVISVYEGIKNAYGKKFSIGMLHGQMDSATKEDVMRRFQQGDIDMLISTTVIEVGIDVANASRLVIYDADRFGLSQLHQLRGRIGRSDILSVCYLLTSTTDQDTLDRLQVLLKHQSGFEIAYQDLLTRGPGELIGVRQSGLPTFRLGNIFEDQKLLLEAKNDAQEVITSSGDDYWKTYVKNIEKDMITSKAVAD